MTTQMIVNWMMLSIGAVGGWFVAVIMVSDKVRQLEELKQELSEIKRKNKE